MTCSKPFKVERDVRDADVIAEREFTLATMPESREGPPIVVKEMGKEYKRCCKKKQAVKEVTFTVSKGHVFGLLGINGAGKTTMFKMLTSEIHPTQGDAYFKGLNANDQLK